MINKKYAAIVLAIGLIASIGIVLSEDKYAEDLAAKEPAYTGQTDLDFPNPEDVKVTPDDQGGLQSEFVALKDMLDQLDQSVVVVPPREVALKDMLDQLDQSVVVVPPMEYPSVYLWIRGSTSYTQYAIVPLGSSVSLLVCIPAPDANPLTTYLPVTTTPGELVKIYSSTPYRDGMYEERTYYNFNLGYTEIPFRSDDVGTYHLKITTIDPTSYRVIQQSNTVVIVTPRR